MYSLCDQTVTVYRMENELVERQVLEGCWLQTTDSLEEDKLGQRRKRKFLLIVPGDTQRVLPGDRVLAGVGPVLDYEQWRLFLPMRVKGLVQVGWVKPYYWEGRLSHIEAGD